MAQQQFNPTADVTTHSDARSLFNSNFSDSENRLSSLEASASQLDGLILQYTQQNLSSSGGVLSIDVSQGYNCKTTLTENTTLSLLGATAGDAGVVIIRQDATGGWGFTSSHTVLSGLLENIQNVSINGVGICSVSWYYDGAEYVIYVSDIT